LATALTYNGPLEGLDDDLKATTNAVAALPFEDNFESYTVGNYPSSPWYNIWTTTGMNRSLAYVTDLHAYSSVKSFYSGGSSWWDSRADGVRINPINNIAYEVDVYVPTLTDEAHIGLCTDYNLNKDYVGVGFRYGRIDAEGHGIWLERGNIEIGRYKTSTWYHVRVEANFDTQKMDVYISDVLLGNQLDMGGTRGKARYNAFALETRGNSSVYYDNVKIFDLTSGKEDLLDYKFDEYGVIQQAYNEEYAWNNASPSTPILSDPTPNGGGYYPTFPEPPYYPEPYPYPAPREPYIDLIPYNESVNGTILDTVSITIKPGEITEYSPQDDASLFADRSTVTWFNTTISDDYDPELFYEGRIFSHPQEITVNISNSFSEIQARVTNIADYPVYNIVVLYPSWRYGILDLLEANEEMVISLGDTMPAEEVKSVLYVYLTQMLNETGLDPTSHRDDWIDKWICEWIDTCHSNQPFALYRIPQPVYKQYFPCSAKPEPKRGMVRVGIVELFNVPITYINSSINGGVPP
jgi:hypothetical protein